MRVLKMMCMIVVALMAAGGVFAQEPVSGLQDLVGARGGDGENQMERRGYTFVKTEKSSTDAYSYWRENENGQCVLVRTADGRYASIVYALASSCEGGDGHQGDHGDSGYDRKDEFETVCSVIVNGENYRYKCKVDDFYKGSQKFRTVLHLPDQTIHLRWKSGRDVELHFEGMNPQQATYSSAEGEIDFFFEDTTYTYISNKDVARTEVQHFQN